jgi:hypothetical protein
MKCVGAMFPDRAVSLCEDGVEVDFGEDRPRITSAQVAELARFDDAGIELVFRNDSRHYESCTIVSYTLVIVSPEAASDR